MSRLEVLQSCPTDGKTFEDKSRSSLEHGSCCVKHYYKAINGIFFIMIYLKDSFPKSRIQLSSNLTILRLREHLDEDVDVPDLSPSALVLTIKPSRVADIIGNILTPLLLILLITLILLAYFHPSPALANDNSTRRNGLTWGLSTAIRQEMFLPRQSLQELSLLQQKPKVIRLPEPKCRS